jgi:hypothetical protein
MAFDIILADRIRRQLGRQTALTEKKMFGGIGFLIKGNMCCGVLGDEVIIRLDPEQAELALREKHTRVFDFSGRPMKGWIFVDAGGVKTANDLKRWVDVALTYCKSLPARK